MSIFPPKLNTILPPMPEINVIAPLSYSSESIQRFPPMKTPKLQDLQNETITYPDFRAQTDLIKIIYPPKEAIGATEIIRVIRKPIERKEEKKEIVIPRSRNYEIFKIILYIILILLIFYILKSFL
jgi:hypothetical protein